MRLVPDGFCKADKCSCNPSIMQNLFKFAFLKTVARLMALLFWVSSGIGNGPKQRVRSGAPMIPDWLEYLLYICNPLGPNTKDLSDHFWVKPRKQTRLGHAGPLAISVEPFPVCAGLRKPFRNRMVRNEVFSCGPPKFNSNVVLGSKVPIS